MEFWFVFCIIFWIFCGVTASVVGESRNFKAGGFIFGLMLGPLGILLTLLIDCRPTCKSCRSRISTRAKICRHCHQPVKSDAPARVFVCTRCSKPIAAADTGGVMFCPRCNALQIIPNEFRRQAKPPEIVRLMPCPDCGQQVSRRATSCPGCGCPIREDFS